MFQLKITVRFSELQSLHFFSNIFRFLFNFVNFQLDMYFDDIQTVIVAKSNKHTHFKIATIYQFSQI